MSNLESILATEPLYRQKQIYSAWFDVSIDSYQKITTLPALLREKLKDEPWLSVKLSLTQESAVDNTQKALLELVDGSKIETVLMGRINKKTTRADKNMDFRYTICISTQVGCPMACMFCATGKLGFTRNLITQEIVDQYRFWQNRLVKTNNGKIDNIVLMGQGEPLLNYENVKEALNIFLHYANIGPRQIALSTVGVPAQMDKMLEDKDFPPIRFALSLHSALEATRQKLLPSHQKGFLDWLPNWAKKYHDRWPSRAHFVGLEYTMINEFNDDDQHLRALIKLAGKLGRTRINLIPCNAAGSKLESAAKEKLEYWQKELMSAGFICTIRRSQGQDIAAACGQLNNQ